MITFELFLRLLYQTLVAAVKAAGLVDTLKGPGPFTVFAPTNAAFAGLPAGTVDTLLKPENKGMLTSVLTYHVVPGKWDAAAIAKMIADGKGTANIKTVAGGMQTVKKTCPAENFGGKKSVKGNRQGVLSRSITRRSGRIAKSCFKIYFAIPEAAWRKSPGGTFLTS